MQEVNCRTITCFQLLYSLRHYRLSAQWRDRSILVIDKWDGQYLLTSYNLVFLQTENFLISSRIFHRLYFIIKFHPIFIFIKFITRTRKSTLIKMPEAFSIKISLLLKFLDHQRQWNFPENFWCPKEKQNDRSYTERKK